MRERSAKARFTIGSLIAAILGSLIVFIAYAQVSIDASDQEILERLAPELSDAIVVTMQDLTEQEANKVRTTPEVGRRFEGDFNSDGQPDLAQISHR